MLLNCKNSKLVISYNNNGIITVIKQYLSSNNLVILTQKGKIYSHKKCKTVGTFLHQDQVHKGRVEGKYSLQCLICSPRPPPLWWRSSRPVTRCGVLMDHFLFSRLHKISWQLRYSGVLYYMTQRTCPFWN